MLKTLKNIAQKFDESNELTFIIDTDLSKYSTMKLEAQGSIILVRDCNSLIELLSDLKINKISYKVIGWGANFIIPKEPDFVLIKLVFEFDKKIFDSDDSQFWVPASAPLNILTSVASKKGFKGWEVFTGIPASAGGAVAMNAGTSLGEISELLKEVKVLKGNGIIESHQVKESSFSYRKNHFLSHGDIVIEVLIAHKGIDLSVKEVIKNYLKLRTDTQPLRENTCGCMFKNYLDEQLGEETTCRAGLSIDIMGLKGLSVNDLRISPKHANFMENRGAAGSSDVLELIQITKRELRLQYGVEFETEVHFPK